MRIQVQVSGNAEESVERRLEIEGKVREARHGRSSAWSSAVSSISHAEEVRDDVISYAQWYF